MTRRGRWLLPALAWLVVAVMALAGLRTAVLLVDSWRGQQRYRQQDYAAARTAFARTTVLNPMSAWSAHFNVGTADYKLGDFEGARDEFSRALSLASQGHTCTVGLNLAWSLEALGGTQRDGGQTAAARQSLDAADHVLAGLDCSSQQATQRAETQQRVQSTLDQLPDTGSDPAADERARQDALRRREQQAQEANQQQRASASPSARGSSAAGGVQRNW
ncbi:Hypothetical protein PFR_JS9-2_285 [Propionibacterium freudenreichii]|nr:Hypothetical protein PFR_JS9-1_287 [Propionibacterium freudenreichii]SCQ66476.1 Hypothetical protein PFR_JS9-2_285 [Propionibacterium freudenreichii]